MPQKGQPQATQIAPHTGWRSKVSLDTQGDEKLMYTLLAL